MIFVVIFIIKHSFLEYRVFFTFYRVFFLEYSLKTRKTEFVLKFIQIY